MAKATAEEIAAYKTKYGAEPHYMTDGSIRPIEHFDNDPPAMLEGTLPDNMKPLFDLTMDHIKANKK